ncbi:MAG: SGNH/GDSL hydrolase family protein [bacterium]
MLIIGHSHLMLSTDKERIEKELGVNVSKYTREGVNVYDREVMIEQYLNSKYSDSLKVVLYGVDLYTFTGAGLSENVYKLFYPFIDDKYIDSYVKHYADDVDYWMHKIIRTTRYNDDVLKNAAVRGWCKNWDNMKYGNIDINHYKAILQKGDERNILMEEELIISFKRTIDNIICRNIKVVLINTPTIDLLNNYDRDKFNFITDWFLSYAANNNMVEYWDFNPEYADQYSIFYDKIHLNSSGQQIITTEIIEQLQNSQILID